MALKGWVAEHTGLPSFHVTGSGPLVADVSLLGSVIRQRTVTRVFGEALFSDVGGPVGSPVTYRFGNQSVTLTRRGTGGPSSDHQWVTDVSGQVIAEVSLLGDDEREYATDAHVFTSALGNHVPRYSLGQPPQSGTLEVATTGAGTLTLRDLVQAKAPLWVVHNAGACQIPGCDIEGARLVVPQRFREVRSARRDVAHRVWDVDYVRVPDALGDIGSEGYSAVPVVTWGEWERHTGTLGWQNLSALDLAGLIAGMP